ncbi:hypothetical protein DYBT9623_03974 [Dyadobacter sp. CECT 9623]|uniref:Acyltransferase 3 domain-containing protein n=1 Tax=Dyadobacter linearis TaxID=2823330 RepID=A0ABM8UUJ5_9BACT|nr:acyltransferase [Dyadobacter sp. CECT 9623]CAG5072036.1 hypothetical protein DYBT9623_03974 [Dyadobacter sp. CECT 9623]
MPINTKEFRYDINALRALAVLGVVLFHYKVPYFQGGFSGVDIFFVISGYLMTRIIIRGLAKGNFSVIEFYSRRVKRILPGLLFLILCLTVINFFLYLPVDYSDFVKNAAASAVFYSNILYYKSDYFDASSENNMLLHTWSLSVEWQFYLILPLVLMLVNRFLKNDRRGYLAVFLIAAVLIFVGSLFATDYRPNASFYWCQRGAGK